MHALQSINNSYYAPLLLILMICLSHINTHLFLKCFCISSAFLYLKRISVYAVHLPLSATIGVPFCTGTFHSLPLVTLAKCQRVGEEV